MYISEKKIWYNHFSFYIIVPLQKLRKRFNYPAHDLFFLSSRDKELDRDNFFEVKKEWWRLSMELWGDNDTLLSNTRRASL